MRRVIISSASSLSTRKLLGSTLFWIGFGIFGWYFPRSLIHADTSIPSLQPPYQISGGDTVIVDFELNQPLVDPPTVDSEFSFFRHILLGSNHDIHRLIFSYEFFHPLALLFFFSSDPLLRSTSILIPLLVFVLHSWYGNSPNSSTDVAGSNSKPNSTTLQKVYLVATVISAFSAALGLSEGCTVMIKLWVKRRRPNFYALCGFDYATKKCMADLKHVREVRRDRMLVSTISSFSSIHRFVVSATY